MRVPEAYPLLVPYEAVRPGLLVLDADGRRVDAFSLVEGLKGGPDAVAVARFLRDALKAPALERVTLRTSPANEEAASALAVAAGKVPGVERAEARKDGVFLVAGAGVLSPSVITGLAERVKAAVEFVEPVPVTFTAAASTDPLRAAHDLLGVAGTWYAADDERKVRAWVTGLLLDPRRLEESAGCGSDLEGRRYDLPEVSTGPPGMKIAQAVRGVPGVLGVFPALASESLAVVGRREKVRWPDVLAALRGTGVEAREAAK